MNAANFIQRQRPPGFIHAQGASAGLLQIFGQVSDVDKLGGCGDGGAGDYVFKLSNISGPIMLEQDCLSPSSETPK